MRGSLVSLYLTDIKEASYAFTHELSSPCGLQGTATGVECMHSVWNYKTRAHILSLKQETRNATEKGSSPPTPKAQPQWHTSVRPHFLTHLNNITNQLSESGH